MAVDDPDPDLEARLRAIRADWEADREAREARWNAELDAAERLERMDRRAGNWRAFWGLVAFVVLLVVVAAIGAHVRTGQQERACAGANMVLIDGTCQPNQ